MTGPWLSGEKINLRPPRDMDVVRRVRWLNDPETAVLWAIETKDHWHIGDLDIHGMDLLIRSARLTILIGNKDYWGQGYGADAVETMLRYAFGTLMLDTVNLRVYGFNQRGIRCYEECGFVRTGESFGSWPDYGGEEKHEIFMTAHRERLQAERPYERTLLTRSG